jgi:hypothetical protein
MTFRDLKLEVERMAAENGPGLDNQEVMVGYDYGDYCHTTAMSRLTTVALLVPQKSGYSPTGLSVPDDWPEQVDDDRAFESPENPPVVVLM